MKQTVQEAAKEMCDAWGMEDNHGYSVKDTFQVGFVQGSNWQQEQYPWIDINDRSVIMPDDKMCLLRLEDGSIVRDTEEWEDRRLLVTHWMLIPNF